MRLRKRRIRIKRWTERSDGLRTNEVDRETKAKTERQGKIQNSRDGEGRRLGGTRKI